MKVSFPEGCRVGGVPVTELVVSPSRVLVRTSNSAPVSAAACSVERVTKVGGRRRPGDLYGVKLVLLPGARGVVSRVDFDSRIAASVELRRRFCAALHAACFPEVAPALLDESEMSVLSPRAEASLSPRAQTPAMTQLAKEAAEWQCASCSGLPAPGTHSAPMLSYTCISGCVAHT